MKGVVFFAAAASLAVSLGQPASAAERWDAPSTENERRTSDEAERRKKRRHFDNGIKQIVYIQFDNVHVRRDNPNVPSDLQQMPNLLNFLEDEGTLFTNHFTPLISHTAVDILTSLTGVYGDKFGVPIGNNIGLFNQNGVASFPSSFTYWTDLMADGLPEMLDQRGMNAPGFPGFSPTPSQSLGHLATMLARISQWG
jgi:hypothetical protein